MNLSLLEKLDAAVKLANLGPDDAEDVITIAHRFIADRTILTKQVPEVVPSQAAAPEPSKTRKPRTTAATPPETSSTPVTPPTAAPAKDAVDNAMMDLESLD